MSFQPPDPRDYGKPLQTRPTIESSTHVLFKKPMHIASMPTSRNRITETTVDLISGRLPCDQRIQL